jgi:hypothetical protein
MIVYREQRTRVATADVLRRVGEASGFERAMELGELHAGVADAWCPDFDRDLHDAPLPPEIEISVPEGFAWYALDPELYRIAARRFAAAAHPDRVAVIGIRSIGTTLGAVVADELGPTARLWTVRPRGHPFDRQLRVDSHLERAWREWGGHFAVVDEGPGLSGSSFASVAEFLSGLDVPDDRIVFLPSWQPDGAGFVSETARRRWARHRKYSAAFEELGLFDDAGDLSAGRWRTRRCVWPAVQPQHERRKYLRGDRLYKFAGYGRYGRAKLERAQRLAAFVPPTLGFENGFLVTRWIPGRTPRITTAFLEHLAKYLAHIVREFPTGRAANVDQLAELIAVNTGKPWTGPLPEAQAIALDARLLPHEWLETAGGYLKTDALDHHDDHFFPGPQDIAWDLAAGAVEFGGEPYLLDCYRRASGDRDVAGRLPFYKAAYLAFRLGYCDMAAQSLGNSPDGARFHRARRRYAELIRSESCTSKPRQNQSTTTRASRLSA